MISRILTPPGGWKFQQGEYWLTGDSFDELKDTVTFHRISNGIEVGNVEEDIETQIVQLNPKSKVNLIKLKATNGRKHV